MADRKSYSKRREDALYAVVGRAFTDFRIKILRGHLTGWNATTQEDRVYAELKGLADKVCAEYRKSYAPQREGGGQ
jgi:hypothetical protein